MEAESRSENRRDQADPQHHAAPASAFCIGATVGTGIFGSSHSCLINLPGVTLIAMCVVLLIRGATADPGEQLAPPGPARCSPLLPLSTIVSITMVVIHPDPQLDRRRRRDRPARRVRADQLPGRDAQRGTLAAVMVLRLRGLGGGRADLVLLLRHQALPTRSA